MQPDPQRVADTKDWLVRAANDLRAADHGLTAEPPLLFDVVFHSQQAAEKALKGLLAWHDEPFRKTHSLVELGEQCVGVAASLEPLLRRAAPLTEYAWKFRYPRGPLEPPVGDAEAALTLAREVYEVVLALLPGETHP